jgi:hypothetical protein
MVLGIPSRIGYRFDCPVCHATMVLLDHARLLPAHLARLRLGLRCVLRTKRLFRALLGPMLA